MGKNTDTKKQTRTRLNVDDRELRAERLRAAQANRLYGEKAYAYEYAYAYAYA